MSFILKNHLAIRYYEIWLVQQFDATNIKSDSYEAGNKELLLIWSTIIDGQSSHLQ